MFFGMSSAMRHGNLRIRLFLLFTLLIALTVGSLDTIFIIYQIRAYREDYRGQAELMAQLLANDIRLPLFAGDVPQVKILAENALLRKGVRQVLVTDMDGNRIADYSHKPPPSSGERIGFSAPVVSASHAPPPQEALLGEAAVASRSTLGWVYLEMDSAQLVARIRSMVVSSAAVGLLFMLLSSGIGYVALKRTTRTFDRLMMAVSTIETGDYSHSLPATDDEPGRVAGALNSLAQSLQRRELENQRLRDDLINALRLEVQEEKKLWMARLIQANRMTSLGLMVSSMSHEINNPNATVALSANFLGKAWRDGMPLMDGVAREEGDFSLGGVPYSLARHEIGDCIEKIVTNSGRIAHVVQDLRNYGLGLKDATKIDVDLNAVVSSAMTIVRGYIHKSSVPIRLEEGRSLPLLKAHHQQLEQVVINLVLNAIQASGEGAGEVLVATAHDPAKGEVVISVTDHGEGIPASQRERLFEPFQSTRIAQGGSGLGLYISKFIITEHGGRIEIDSKPGLGTCVRVCLPLTDWEPDVATL